MKSSYLLATAVILVVAGIGYLFWNTTAPSKQGNPDDPDLVAVGENLYAQNCASCHGANLEGQPNWRERKPDGTFPAPPHDESGHTWHHDDELLFLYTKHGGAALARGRFQSGMPGFGDELTDREIRAIIAFIKSRWPQHIREAQQQRQRR